MIPSDRPVLGKDLETLRHQFGLMTSEACWLLGLSINRWMKTARQESELPITDHALALLVRLLDQNPGLSAVPEAPTAQEMFDAVNAAQKTTQATFSVMFGKDATASYRWLSRGARPPQSVARLMLCLRLQLLSARPGAQSEIVESWKGTVKREGQARGVPDVIAAGKWTLEADAAPPAPVKRATQTTSNPRTPRKRPAPSPA